MISFFFFVERERERGRGRQEVEVEQLQKNSKNSKKKSKKKTSKKNKKPQAVAYDNPIPGFRTNNTINLRLWASRPDREFDLEAFNTGDYIQAILARQRA